MRTLNLSFLLLVLFSSCKDETETPSVLVADKLKAEISAYFTDIERVEVLSIYDQSIIATGETYEITSDGFIVLSNDNGYSSTFNLSELKSYRLFNGILTLYY